MVAQDATHLIWTFDQSITLLGPVPALEWRNGAGPWDTMNGWEPWSPTQIRTEATTADYSQPGDWRIVGSGPLANLPTAYAPQGAQPYTELQEVLITAVHIDNGAGGTLRLELDQDAAAQLIGGDWSGFTSAVPTRNWTGGIGQLFPATLRLFMDGTTTGAVTWDLATAVIIEGWIVNPASGVVT